MGARRIAQVVVEHGYFASGICRSVGFSPSEETAREVARHRWMVRGEDGGFSLHALDDSSNGSLRCRFAARSTDPSFWLYTADPTSAPVGIAAVGGTGAEVIDVTFPGVEACARSVEWMFLEFQATVGADTPPQGGGPSWRIRLEPRKYHWKYFLGGEFARSQVEVGDSEGAIRFVPAEDPGSLHGRCVLSDRAIASQQHPPQRLQLRDTETGRVLIKRLPLPDFRRLGRQRLPSGETALVAEIFINP